MQPRKILISALVCALVCGSAAWAGTVTGTVTYADKVPNFKPLNMNADPKCAEKHSGPVYPDMLVLGDGNTMANIFVQVKNPPAKDYPTPSEPTVVDQVGCRYVPHVAGVMVGQTLLFKNSDGIMHNVHGRPEKNREFNIGMPPAVKESERTFNSPEPLFSVKCDVHPWMNSFIAVMTHPYFDVTEKDGKFEIDGLPAGTYTIEAWHEKLGTRTAEVTVGADGSASADFSYKMPQR